MDNNSSKHDARDLIKNILVNNIDDIEDVRHFLTISTSSLDIAMILLALDVSNLQTSNLKLVANQFKNILLEQYLDNSSTNNTNNTTSIIKENNNITNNENIKSNITNSFDDFDDIDDDNYNNPDSPILCYGEESADGFIYIDGRHAMPYEPLTEEKALKFVFLEKKLLPPKGSKGHVDQRFEYFTDDNEARMCIRKFVIDDKGHVVRFLGEHTKPINLDNPLITEDEGFTNGTLADLLNIND